MPTRRSKGSSTEDSRPGQEPVPSPATVFRGMYSVSKRLPDYFDKVLGTLDLRLTEFGVLQQLSSSGPTPMVRLSDENLVTKAAVTAIVDEMEAKGLVRRVRDSSDRRVVNVQMTPAGKKLFTVAMKRHQEIVNAVSSLLEPDEVRAVVRCFDKLARFMDEHGV